ncbi:hypothetical protein [uncultured Psychroserpens sp.]|uniref:hypothetical protein n=1 Tax=uncultured Psychroserpens sp. TaxID=255436 RepID=UPI00261BB3C9|nr:hypothetical protein [uncultured Psychroserpens sp.]
MTKIKYLILLCFFSFFYCKNSGNEVSTLSDEKKMLVEEVVNHVVSNLKIDDKPYLVDPFFNKFEFNSYTHNYRDEIPKDKNKAILLDKYNWSNEEFAEIENKVNQNYYDKLNKELLGYSNGEKANWVIKFSGFYEKFIFIEVFNFCEMINKEQLISNEEIEKKPKWEVTSYVYELKENKIENKLVDNIIIHELPCGDDKLTHEIREH